jgi:hypothetical protein
MAGQLWHDIIVKPVVIFLYLCLGLASQLGGFARLLFSYA